jgi:hypothetical protein
MGKNQITGWIFYLIDHIQVAGQEVDQDHQKKEKERNINLVFLKNLKINFLFFKLYLKCFFIFRFFLKI